MTDDAILDILSQVVRDAIAQTSAQDGDVRTISISAPGDAFPSPVRPLQARWAFLEARGLEADLARLADAGLLHALGTAHGVAALLRGRLLARAEARAPLWARGAFHDLGFASTPAPGTVDLAVPERAPSRHRRLEIHDAVLHPVADQIGLRPGRLLFLDDLHPDTIIDLRGQWSHGAWIQAALPGATLACKVRADASPHPTHGRLEPNTFCWRDPDPTAARPRGVIFAGDHRLRPRDGI